VSGDSVRRVLIQCDEAAVPSSRARDNQMEHLALSSAGSSANLDIDLTNLAACALRTIRDRAADLVRIASYVYAADQSLSRGGPTDVYLRHWRRDITLYIQVTEPDYWGQPHITEQLSEVLNYLTEDTWQFVFLQGPSAIKQLSLKMKDPIALAKPDSVLLFSGGADSLCAAVEAVGGRRERPVLVSHQPAPSHFALQQRLVRSLEERFSIRGLHHLGFRIHRRGGDPVDSSQRSRPFLFASLGTAVAGELELPTVWLSDNGLVGLGLPINGSPIGAQTSRSAHPKFLRLFNMLVADLFPMQVQVSNPFELRTRAQVLTQLQAHGCPELLAQTESCSRTRGLPAGQRHCGTCSQCVDRRFGSITAGLERHDPASGYRLDIFKDPLREGTERTTAVSYVQLARDLLSATPDDLFLNHGELFEAVSTGGNTLARANEVSQLLHRHGEAVVGALEHQIDRYKHEIASGTLPDTCLLQLVTGTRRTVEPTLDPAINICRQVGDQWELVFRGKRIWVKDLKGMRYLARLLWTPEEFVPASGLEAEASVEAGGHDEINRMSNERARAEGLSAGKPDGLGWRVDPIGEGAIQARIQKLEAQRDAARAAGNAEAAVDADEDIAELQQYLRANRGLGGRPRPMGDAGEQARDRVRKDLDAAINHIRRHDAQLGQHLKATIRRGIECAYQPGAIVEWQQ
jgi:hypothetical protein